MFTLQRRKNPSRENNFSKIYIYGLHNIRVYNEHVCWQPQFVFWGTTLLAQSAANYPKLSPSHCSLITKIHSLFIPANYFFSNITTHDHKSSFPWHSNSWESLKLSGSLSVTSFFIISKNNKKIELNNHCFMQALRWFSVWFCGCKKWFTILIPQTNKYFMQKSYNMMSMSAPWWTGDIFKVKRDYFVFTKFLNHDRLSNTAQI